MQNPPRELASDEMSQEYVGVKVSNDAALELPITSEDSCSEFDDEYKPSNKFMSFINSIVPHGGAISNIYSLASVTLGSGIISLPCAFQGLGIVPSIIVLIIISLSCVFSTYILLEAVDKTGRRAVSYEALARLLLGRGWDYLAAFNMWIICFGSCVAYVISIGDVLVRTFDSSSVSPFLRSKWGNRIAVTIIWFCLMLPMCIPRQINALRFCSVIGVMFIVYFVVVVVIHSCAYGFKDGKPKGEYYMFRGGNNAIVGFSLFIFSFMCQTNTLEVYREMSRPSPGRLSRDTAISMGAVLILYICTGLFAYLEFGNKITDSLLLYYDVHDSMMLAVSYMGLSFKLCVAFAICMQPTRDSTYYCLSRYYPVFKHVRTVPFWLNTLICSFLALLALICGLFTPSVNIVFGLVGSFCGGFICFIFPALYIMYCGNWTLKEVGWFKYIFTYLLLLSGVAAVIFGTVASIYSMI